MKKLRIVLLGIFITINLFAQDERIWILKSDPTNPESLGYVDRNNLIKIPYGKYRMCYTDTFKIFAIVLKDNEGFIGIDKKENKLFTVFPFDNGPDYVTDGTFRIIENSKMGIADTSGKIIVPPIYDFTLGFEQGLALVNIGGHREKSDPTDPNCEYYTWRGGRWGIIDRKGGLILKIRYSYDLNPETKIQELTRKRVKYEIIDGQLIKKDRK